MLEKDLESSCVQEFKKHFTNNCIIIKNISHKGFPDRMFIVEDIIIFVEFKRNASAPISEAQALYIKKLKKLGHKVFVVSNKLQFKIIIQWLEHKRNLREVRLQNEEY